MALILAAALAALTVLRHLNFRSEAYDLGFYIQDVWRIGHGDWSNSISGFGVFADHFSPILILIAPLSWLGSTALALLVLQAVVVGSGVIACFRLGQSLRDTRLGWLCVVWFATSVIVWRTVLYDFRPVTLGVMGLIWLIASLESDARFSVVLLLTLLTAICREDVAVLVGVTLVIHAVFKGQSRFKLILLGGGASLLGLWYSLGGSRLFAPFDYFLWYRYADYGATPGEALANWRYMIPTALGRLVRSDPLIAMVALLAPFLLWPVLRGWRRSWPGLLVLLANAISIHPAVPAIYYQYYIGAVPFLLWGGAHGFRSAPWSDRARVAGACSLAVLLGLGPFWFGGYGVEGRTVSGVLAASPRSGMSRVLDALPATASVSAGRYLLPHVAERRQVYPFPGPLVCGLGIVFHVPHTFYPPFLLVEQAETTDQGIDLSKLGYSLATQDSTAQLWKSTGPHPASVACPTPQEARQLQFDYVKDLAR